MHTKLDIYVFVIQDRWLKCFQSDIFWQPISKNYTYMNFDLTEVVT